MRNIVLVVACALLGACGGGNKGATCAVDKSQRPRVAIAWKIEHGSMDSDPPRAHVKVALSGAVSREVDLGELEGVCRLAETGALPDDPANGSKVSEVVCFHAGHGMYATVFLVERGKLAVRRYDRGEAVPGNDTPAIEKVRELASVEVPSCATFAAEIAQGGEL